MNVKESVNENSSSSSFEQSEEESDVSSAESTASKHADGKPKRPKSAYESWLKDNFNSIRAAIKQPTGFTRDGNKRSVPSSIVQKHAGKQWKKLPENEKRPYLDDHAERKAKFDAAMKLYKDERKTR